MSNSFNPRRQVASEMVSQDLGNALRQIDERGSLLRFVSDWAARLEMTRRLSEQRLIAWNKGAGRYELTNSGRDSLKVVIKAHR